MTPDFNLRNATLKDLNKIMNIEKLCFDCSMLETRKLYRERIKSFANGFCILEDTFVNKMIGFITTEIWDSNNKEISFITEHDILEYHNVKGDMLYISSLNVHPRYRNQGYGDFIFSNSIDNIIEQYKNIKSIILIVNEQWKTAVKIYERNSFKKVETIHGFFKDGDGLIYRKIV